MNKNIYRYSYSDGLKIYRGLVFAHNETHAAKRVSDFYNIPSSWVEITEPGVIECQVIE